MNSKLFLLLSIVSFHTEAQQLYAKLGGGTSGILGNTALRLPNYSTAVEQQNSFAPSLFTGLEYSRQTTGYYMLNVQLAYAMMQHVERVTYDSLPDFNRELENRTRRHAIFLSVLMGSHHSDFEFLLGFRLGYNFNSHLTSKSKKEFYTRTRTEHQVTLTNLNDNRVDFGPQGEINYQFTKQVGLYLNGYLSILGKTEKVVESFEGNPDVTLITYNDFYWWQITIGLRVKLIK